MFSVFNKVKKYYPAVRVEIKNISTVIPRNVKKGVSRLIVVGNSEEGIGFGNIVEFGNIKKPLWFQFWKKKAYLKAVEEDKRRFKEIFGGPSKIDSIIKQQSNNQ